MTKGPPGGLFIQSPCAVLSLRPTRLACFSWTHVPHTVRRATPRPLAVVSNACASASVPRSSSSRAHQNDALSSHARGWEATRPVMQLQLVPLLLQSNSSDGPQGER